MPGRVYKMILKNKKADISIAILVLGVVALCFLTLLSFSKKNSDVESSFAGIGLIETVKSIAEENAFYSQTEFSSGDYMNNQLSRGNVKIEVNGNIIDGSYAKSGTSLARVTYKR